jgi:uncharacterized cupin superfamily protein
MAWKAISPEAFRASRLPGRGAGTAADEPRARRTRMALPDTMPSMRRLKISDPAFTYDDADPRGFRAGLFRLGSQVAAEHTGVSVYELPPGQAVCPYHYEYGEEEWVLVLEGQATVRTPDGSERLEPLEMAFFPRGPAGAHQIRNDTDARVRVLMFSEVVYPTATAYPDSDKVGVWTGDKAEDLMAPRSSKVDYFHGEAGEARRGS